MRARILAGMSLAAVVAGGVTAAPAIAAPVRAPAATVCDAVVDGDELYAPDGQLKAAAVWTVQCPEDRHVRVTVDYVTGEHAAEEADVAAGEGWTSWDFSPTDDGSGVNSVVTVYENGEQLTQVALNWD
ncbi:hypothetical protein [Actinomadura litoris]|uniref:Secreted protein n=1 Tax=Actinomadura litoris TaxID=2678616 RepID=A0A7K1L515_9ACTN|nr:hypothetical protein [Actinomadura litoris]MUN39345.1 hypothetical protein [Actinomadura litoris]